MRARRRRRGTCRRRWARPRGARAPRPSVRSRTAARRASTPPTASPSSRGYAPDRLDLMPHPDIGLDVRAPPGFDAHRDEATGDDVVSVLRELEARPLLPLVARAGDGHREGRHLEQLRTDPLVRAQPRVVGEAVLA